MPSFSPEFNPFSPPPLWHHHFSPELLLHLLTDPHASTLSHLHPSIQQLEWSCQNISLIIQTKSTPSNSPLFHLKNKPESLQWPTRPHIICSTPIISLTSSPITLSLVHSTSATLSSCCASNTPGPFLPRDLCTCSTWDALFPNTYLAHTPSSSRPSTQKWLFCKPSSGHPI